MSVRRGFTLIEMVAAITVGSVLMVLAMQVIHRTMLAESASRSVDNTERTSIRLARQFRQDVHQAHAVVIHDADPKQVRVNIELIDQPVTTYTVEGSTLTREQTLDGDSTRREVFEFPDVYTTQFTKTKSPSMVVLTVHHQESNSIATQQLILRVAAVVGKYYRQSNTDMSDL